MPGLIGDAMVELRFVSVDELRRSIGKISTSPPIEIEKGAIKKFARAVGASVTLHTDDDRAWPADYGPMNAPEDMLFGIEFTYTPEPVESPAPTVLDGGGEWGFIRPVRAGDVVFFTRKLLEVSERQTSMGKTYFVTTEIVWTNQRGETVAKARLTDISY